MSEAPNQDSPIAHVIEAFRRAQDDDEERSRLAEIIIRRFALVVKKAWSAIVQETGGECDDFAQDVFFRLFQVLPQLRAPEAFPAYFRRVARNVAVDALRRKQREPLTAVLDPTQEIEAMVTRLDVAIYESLLVRTYLSHLPPRERQVLELEYIDGLGPEEIMAVTGIGIGGISSAKSRGMSKLREIAGLDAEKIKRRAGKEKGRGAAS